jgi:hypothetical protein
LEAELISSRVNKEQLLLWSVIHGKEDDVAPGQLLLKREKEAYNCKGHWLDTTFWWTDEAGKLKQALPSLRGDSMGSLSLTLKLAKGSCREVKIHSILAYTYCMPRDWPIPAWSSELLVDHCSTDVPDACFSFRLDI